VCFTLGSDADGQAQTALASIGSETINSANSFSRKGQFANNSKLFFRWPTSKQGAVTVKVWGNDSLASGQETSRSFSIVSPVWTDEVVGPVKAAHISELRSMINNLRQAYGLSTAAWSDVVMGEESVWAAVYILEMRQALEDIRARINNYDASAVYEKIPAFGWSSNAAPNQSIRAAHIYELRNAIVSI
jgi:hypothetical protein